MSVLTKRKKRKGKAQLKGEAGLCVSVSEIKQKEYQRGFRQISHAWKYSCRLNSSQNLVQRHKSLIALCVIWAFKGC